MPEVSNTICHIIDNLQARYPDCYVSAVVTADRVSFTVIIMPIFFTDRPKVSFQFARSILERSGKIKNSIISQFVAEITRILEEEEAKK